MKNYKEFKKQALKNNELKKAYNSLAPEFIIAQAIIKKRIAKGLTQSELAKKVGTRQSAISRFESGNYNPSIHFLDKIAKALSLKLKIQVTNS